MTYPVFADRIQVNVEIGGDISVVAEHFKHANVGDQINAIGENEYVRVTEKMWSIEPQASGRIVTLFINLVCEKIDD